MNAVKLTEEILTCRSITDMPFTMQAESVFLENPLYRDAMAGRPAKSTQRTPFGQRLFDARSKKGHSQRYMAEELGVTQPSYADWERRSMAIKPECIPKLAALLDVTVDYLLGFEQPSHAQSGPVGKARKVFEAVSALPRYQQQRILGMVEDMLIAQEAKAS